jgi:hypothetical protein
MLTRNPNRVWVPPCEDNDREAEVREQQALSAAIDLPSLFKSAQAYIVELFVSPPFCSRSDKSDQNRPQKPEKIISASADLDVPLSSLPLFLAEMPHSNPRLSGASHNRTARPSPHEVVVKGDGLPLVSLKLQSNEQPAAHRKRKRRRSLVERPPAMFWHPLKRRSGKSSGYAMDYE